MSFGFKQQQRHVIYTRTTDFTKQTVTTRNVLIDRNSMK